MGTFWHKHVVPRFQQLMREKLGGLDEAEGIGEYNTNSFRRTWNTLAAEHPDPVSEDLRDRQGNWRKNTRKKKMTSLYFDPRPAELLLATYWL
jgi:hypothetical protein